MATSQHERIYATNILLLFPPDYFDSVANVDAVLVAAEKNRSENTLITSDGHVLMTASVRMSMNNGAATFAKRLPALKQGPVVVKLPGLPISYFQKYFYNGNLKSQGEILARKGDRFSTQYIDQLSSTTSVVYKNRIMNNLVASMSVPELVKTGFVAIGDVHKYIHAKRMMAEDAHEHHERPDLSGVITRQFEQYVENCETGIATLTHAFPPVSVSFKGYPFRKLGNVVGVTHDIPKRRHLWIESRNSGFGKSMWLTYLSETYNAAFLCDRNNWCGIPANTQLLLIDESKAVPCFEELKMITSGNASCFAGNCKSIGRSFTPRSDMQVIIACNKSPFDVLGVYDRKDGRRYVDNEIISVIQSRFKYVCLDGDENERLLSAKHPQCLSDEELRSHVHGMVAKLSVAVFTCPKSEYVDFVNLHLRRMISYMRLVKGDLFDRGCLSKFILDYSDKLFAYQLNNHYYQMYDFTGHYKKQNSVKQRSHNEDRGRVSALESAHTIRKLGFDSSIETEMRLSDYRRCILDDAL